MTLDRGGAVGGGEYNQRFTVDVTTMVCVCVCVCIN